MTKFFPTELNNAIKHDQVLKDGDKNFKTN